jgi:hypothetical protein
MSSVPAPLAAQSQSASTEFARYQTFQQTAGQLQKEGFKIEAVLQMMNYCADGCRLHYRADGIKSTEVEEVKCFTECVQKSYRMARAEL